MTIANDIISLKVPDFDHYLRQGDNLDDIDEYGFTPLIESIITRQFNITKMLLERGVNVNKTDITGRSALHWAVDNNDEPVTALLLDHGANPNAYTPAGLSVLVYPILRENQGIKNLLLQHKAKLSFAQDFILAKLIGHRFELSGDTDLVNPDNEYVEIDYEGFILEFTIAVIIDSLRRYITSFSTRHLRGFFTYFYDILEGFSLALDLLNMQHIAHFSEEDLKHLSGLISNPLLILPVASRGHAIGFIKYKDWWAKVDRGENSLQEGSVNIYKIGKKEAFNLGFIQKFLYSKNPRDFFHKAINQHLGLIHYLTLPFETQIVGNCSWANMQALIPVAFFLQKNLSEDNNEDFREVYDLYHEFIEWDKDRALNECIQRFYTSSMIRKASLASILGAILFQSCNESNPKDLVRAEKILKILTLNEYRYILDPYIEIYCKKNFTFKGNNLLKILDYWGVDSNIDRSAIATGLKSRKKK